MSVRTITARRGGQFSRRVRFATRAGAAIDLTGCTYDGGIYPARNGRPVPDAAPLVGLTVAGGTVVVEDAAGGVVRVKVPKATWETFAAGEYWLELYVTDAAGGETAVLTLVVSQGPMGRTGGT